MNVLETSPILRLDCYFCNVCDRIVVGTMFETHFCAAQATAMQMHAYIGRYVMGSKSKFITWLLAWGSHCHDLFYFNSVQKTVDLLLSEWVSEKKNDFANIALGSWGVSTQKNSCALRSISINEFKDLLLARAHDHARRNQDDLLRTTCVMFVFMHFLWLNKSKHMSNSV